MSELVLRQMLLQECIRIGHELECTLIWSKQNSWIPRSFAIRPDAADVHGLGSPVKMQIFIISWPAAYRDLISPTKRFFKNASALVAFSWISRPAGESMNLTSAMLSPVSIEGTQRLSLIRQESGMLQQWCASMSGGHVDSGHDLQGSTMQQALLKGCYKSACAGSNQYLEMERSSSL